MWRFGLACIVVFSQLATRLALGQTVEVDPAYVERAKRIMECGSLRNAVGPWDYRMRESTERLSWDYNDNMTYHYNPAIARMRAGEYTQPVIADLDFLMRVWPNHIPGLLALVQYERGGGKIHQFRTVECYFERALRFAPDDVGVALHQGHYYMKRKDHRRARESYEDALRMQPDSADVNYNVGLFYFDTREYDKALHHAQIAYSLGYPLPGLRRKLEKLGYWKEGAAGTGESPDQDGPEAQERISAPGDSSMTRSNTAANSRTR